LSRGASRALTITCYDNRSRRLGNPNPASAEWGVANTGIATIDHRGRVTARAAGTTTVRMWHDERPVRDSIQLTVTGGAPAPGPGPAPAPQPGPTPSPAPTPPPNNSPQPPPPPTGTPAPSAGFPNQPSGMFIITDRQFDSKAKNNNDRGSSGSDGWSGSEYNQPNFSIVADPTAPNGDGLVGQMFFPAGMKAGTGPGLSTIYFPPRLTELYVSVWAKISSNWVGNQASINKMFFIGVSGGNNQFILTAYGAGSQPLHARMSLQGILDPRSFIMPAPGQVPRGKWQRYEIVLRCNSGLLSSDGTADLWIDGTHVSSARNINWIQTKHLTRPCNMNMFNWNPTYGGGGASPGVNQYLWFDRVYISGK